MSRSTSYHRRSLPLGVLLKSDLCLSRCSPPPPGMPELSALPSDWAHVSVDLQHTVYFAGFRGNMGSWLKIYRWPLTTLQWRVSRPHSSFGESELAALSFRPKPKQRKQGFVGNILATHNKCCLNDHVFLLIVDISIILGGLLKYPPVLWTHNKG